MRKATYKLFIMIVILNEQLCTKGKLGKELSFYIFKCKMKNSTTKIADTIYCLFIWHRCWTSQENRLIKGKIHFYISLISRIQFAGRCKGEIFVRNAKRGTSCFQVFSIAQKKHISLMPILINITFVRIVLLRSKLLSLLALVYEILSWLVQSTGDGELFIPFWSFLVIFSIFPAISLISAES